MNGYQTSKKIYRELGLTITSGALRYWEKEGLLPEIIRKPSGHRDYKPHLKAVKRLAVLRKGFDFEPDKVRAIMAGHIESIRELARKKDLHRGPISRIVGEMLYNFRGEI